MAHVRMLHRSSDRVRALSTRRAPVGRHEACGKARKAYDKRTPSLFKVEWYGDGFVGLCSKTYYCFGATDKYRTKGLNKRHNEIDKDAFLDVLTNRPSGSGKNRGFLVNHLTVLMYVQERAALTYFYAKRVVHEDGVSTGPVDVLKRRWSISSFIGDHGCSMETSLHVRRRWTDGVWQGHFRDAYNEGVALQTMFVYHSAIVLLGILPKLPDNGTNPAYNHCHNLLSMLAGQRDCCLRLAT